jgi:CDP-diacylglycerol---serine O-phosphatidyltransferase
MSPSRDGLSRSPLQRGVIILPSAFTIGNLFFGIFSMVSASRGDYAWAGWCIVFAAILDMLDGRIARFTRTGSQFGAELDSLVDAISFGVAPALLMYHLFLADQPWGWILSFAYVTAGVVRLARFNVQQGGEAKKHFHGLPSPTAGMLLATIYPFFTHPQVAGWVGGLPQTQTAGMIMMGVALLMVSNIPYPMVPRVSFTTRQGTFMTIFLGVSAILAIYTPERFIFPFLVIYTLKGVIQSFVLGLLDRLPEQDPLLDVAEDDEAHEAPRSVDYGEIAPQRPPSSENPS